MAGKGIGGRTDWRGFGDRNRLKGCADDRVYLVIKACAAPFHACLFLFSRWQRSWPGHSGALLH